MITLLAAILPLGLVPWLSRGCAFRARRVFAGDHALDQLKA